MGGNGLSMCGEHSCVGNILVWGTFSCGEHSRVMKKQSGL